MNKQKLSEADHVSELFFKKVVGSITANEQAELDAWVAEGDRRREYAERLASAHYLQEERQRLQAIDARRAMQQMQQRIAASRPQTVPMWRRWAAAAAVAVLLAAGALIWWQQYTKVVPPTISEAVQTAMLQSQQSGRDAADVATGTFEELTSDMQNNIASDKHGLTRTDYSARPANPAQPKSVSVRVSPMQKSTEAVKQLLAAQRVTTRSDSEYWLTLPDGSVVHLNYNTRVIYPEQFTGATRDIILDGEAYFMVAKDRRHPFIVHTPQGDIKEYGTEFNVNTRAESAAASPQACPVEVVLVEGSISVTPTSGTEQMMKPGQMATLTTQHSTLTPVDISPYVAWNSGNFVFEDCTLGQLMDVFERWYDCEVEFDSEATREIRFTGEMDKYGSPEPMLEAIQTVTGLEITHSGNRVTIKHKLQQ